NILKHAEETESPASHTGRISCDLAAIGSKLALAAQAQCNALTVDVEDYFHVSALASRIDRESWSSLDYRVEASTGKLLDLFAEFELKATFFVLGWVAERSP